MTNNAPFDRAFIHAFAERLLAVWNKHDTTDLPELVTEDVVWIDPMLVEPARGVEEVRRFMESSWRSMPDLNFDASSSLCFADDAPVVMAPWRMTGTHQGRFDPPGLCPDRSPHFYRGDRRVHLPGTSGGLLPSLLRQRCTGAAARAPARFRKPRRTHDGSRTADPSPLALVRMGTLTHPQPLLSQG
jgi:hypothetical protein